MKGYLINCLEWAFFKYGHINQILFCEGSTQTIREIIIPRFLGLGKDVYQGDDDVVTTKYAAYCLNFVIIPHYTNYHHLQALQQLEGSDYLFFLDVYSNRALVLESKGDGTELCPNNRFSKARKQIQQAFEYFNMLELQFGYVGIPCFKKNTYYLIKLENT